MEGYINSAFSSSTSTLSRLWGRQKKEEKDPATPEKVYVVDPDTDLDMDSFLSNLEKDSERRDTDSFYDIDLNFTDGQLRFKYADEPSNLDSYRSGGTLSSRSGTAARDGLNMIEQSATGEIPQPARKTGDSTYTSGRPISRASMRGVRRFTPRSAPPPCIPEEAEDPVFTRQDDGRISLRLAQNEDITISQVESRPKTALEKPAPSPGNLFGLIDQNKLASLLRTIYSPSSSTDTSPREGIVCCPGLFSSLDISCLLGVCSLVLLIMAMASPYWISSYHETQSPFIRLGPWEACFNRFRYPRYQFDRVFNGCHAVWGWEYRLIREWLLPPWFLVVQGFLLLSFILCVLSRQGSNVKQCLSVVILVRYPLPVLLRFGYQLVLLVSVLDFIIGFVLALTTTIFGICCWGREWLMYPNYNHLSWGWVAVLLSSFFHLLSSIMFFKESGLERRRKELNDHLLAQLEPPPILSQLEALPGMYI